MNDQPTDKTCGYCKWYDGWMCKRHAPLASFTFPDDPAKAKWPSVMMHDWCGDWEPKEDEAQSNP